MISWNKKLYFGEGIKKNHRRLIRTINKKKPAIGVYCITFASNTENLFDIIPAKEFLFPVYDRMEFHILGLASGRDEAILVVTDMLLEIYEATGGFNVRDYFTQKK